MIGCFSLTEVGLVAEFAEIAAAHLAATDGKFVIRAKIALRRRRRNALQILEILNVHVLWESLDSFLRQVALVHAHGAVQRRFPRVGLL